VAGIKKGSEGQFFENICPDDTAAQKTADDDQAEAQPAGVDGQAAQAVADENT